MMSLWVPAEKQIKIGRGIRRETFSGETGILISGVDTHKGINMTGGTEAGYRKVLSQFYKDAVERLPVFAVPPEETMVASFAAQAHAIKSAAGTIGAAEVSAEAAALEAAGKAGDMAAIREGLPGFHEHLAKLAAEIGKFLEKDEEKKDKDLPAKDGGQTVDLTSLSVLRAALEEKDMKQIDKLIEEVEGLSLNAKDREVINAVSDKVLMGEYKEALDELDRLFAEPEAPAKPL
jgi:HPt (histidine-containing phosphotransfer) domain-containing protein